MEKEITKPNDERLGFIKELAQIAYAFGHDDGVFRKKVFEFINIDSLKEKEVFCLNENSMNEEIWIAINDNKLSKKEVELCGLLQQGFTADEITVILGLKNIRSVHVKQSRIKKKLRGEASPEIVLVMLILCILAWIALKLMNYSGY